MEKNLENRNEFNHKKLLYLPIKIVLLYFGILLLIYKLGPMEWNTENPFLLYLYLFLAHILFYLGYVTTINKIRFNNSTLYVERRKELIVSHSFIIKYLNLFILLNLIMTILFLIRVTGLTSFSVSAILENAMKGFTDPGSQYNDKFGNDYEFGGGILAPLYTFLSPFLWPVIPLAIIYFKKISFLNKLLLILTILFELIRWISIGTNKGVIDIILIIMSIIILKQWQKKYLKKQTKKILSNKMKIMIISLFLIFSGFSLFQNNISSRIDGSYSIIKSITNQTEVNVEAPLMKVIPQDFQPLLVYTSLYLTQGYYGLSLALNEPYIPLMGIGNSYFLISNFEELLGLDIWSYTYQARLAVDGWHPLMNWHSIYVWFANDISFVGVLILMFFIGKYFAHVIFRSLVNEDPIASVLFCLLVISFFYFSSNNQVLSSPSLFMSFIGLNILWYYKINFNKKLSKRKFAL